MISVCLTTYNGELYIREQLNSILSQISPIDEIVVSDDGSTDRTLEIIEDFYDERIRVFRHKKNPQKKNYDYVTRNFEYALSKCKGNYIFLSDQDDIWLPNKVKLFLEQLLYYDLVISDCMIVDDNLNINCNSYFELIQSKKGIIQNVIKNSYLGCCMAFKREILVKALPFPCTSGIAHDIWLGLIAECFFSVKFLNKVTLLYRRHNNNVSPSSQKSTIPFWERINYRLRIIYYLFLKKIK